MKKTLLIGLLVLLTGCSTNNKPKPTPTPTTTPSETPTSTPTIVKEAKDVVGEETQFGTPIVSLKMVEGKITEVMIDEITSNGSKRELKDEYKLSDKAVAPWITQVDRLQAYIVEKGTVDEIELKDGKVTNEDLKTSVTINVEEYIKTINKAINEAK